MLDFFKEKNKTFSQQKTKVKIDQYFHILYNPNKKTTRLFKLHKSIPFSVFFLMLSSLIAVGVISKNYLSLRYSLTELERINEANRNLKSEVQALTNKIKNIQATMNQVESLSSKIKKASLRADDRAKNGDSKQINQSGDSKQVHQTGDSDSLGIGPLTKEEYEISKHLTNVKHENLQLKTLFDEVDDSEAESSKKLADFKKLIIELRKYNQKLQLVPDLAPTRGRLSSTYGWRLSPFSGRERMHLGLDIAAPLGTAIYATADGVVVRTALTEDYGRMLEIQHTNKILTRYGHTSHIYVKEGQKVKKGDVIAAVGSTGRSTGPHVHYEIELDGKRIDPENYIVLW